MLGGFKGVDGWAAGNTDWGRSVHHFLDIPTFLIVVDMGVFRGHPLLGKLSLVIALHSRACPATWTEVVDVGGSNLAAFEPLDDAH